MAYSIVQNKRAVQASDATSWSATFDNPTVSGNTIVCLAFAVDSSNDTMTGMSFADAGTNSFTSVAEQNHPGGFADRRIAMHYVPNCVGKTTHVITVTPTASGAGFLGVGDIEIIEIGNVTTSPLDGTPTTNNGTVSPESSGAITPTNSGVRIAAMSYSAFGTCTTTPNGTWTNIFVPVALFGTVSIYKSAVGGVSDSPAWTTDINPDAAWAAVHAVFDQSVAGVSYTLMGQACL